MCALLSDFLRTTLGLSGKAEIPLSEEIALARRYLAVERVRFGDRLGFTEDLDPGAADSLVPPLLLQPLVENAVKHGIASRLDGGTLTIVTKRFGDRVSIVVENPADADAPPARVPGHGHGPRERRPARRGVVGRLGPFRGAARGLDVPRRDRAARARVSEARASAARVSAAAAGRRENPARRRRDAGAPRPRAGSGAAFRRP